MVSARCAATDAPAMPAPITRISAASEDISALNQKLRSQAQSPIIATAMPQKSPNLTQCGRLVSKCDKLVTIWYIWIKCRYAKNAILIYLHRTILRLQPATRDLSIHRGMTMFDFIKTRYGRWQRYSRTVSELERLSPPRIGRSRAYPIRYSARRARSCAVALADSAFSDIRRPTGRRFRLSDFNLAPLAAFRRQYKVAKSLNLVIPNARGLAGSVPHVVRSRENPKNSSALPCFRPSRRAIV